MRGTLHDPGLLPRVISQVFEQQEKFGTVMTVRMVEVYANTLLDMLGGDLVPSLALDDVHVRTTTLQNAPVVEAFVQSAASALQLVLEAADRSSRGGASAAGKPHLVTILRLESPGAGTAASMYLADLAGTQDLEAIRVAAPMESGAQSLSRMRAAARIRAEYKSGIATNGNLVRAAGLCG